MLPNAWDPPSARLLATLGFPVIATTSAGVAETIGYADGEQTPAAEMLAAVGRIADAVDVPVTADLEAGYGLPANELVAGLLGAGAIGLNIEDTDHGAGGTTLVETRDHAARLEAIKEAGREVGVDVVLNARVDVYLRGGDEAEGLARAEAYVEAGADSVYPIGLGDEEGIKRWVETIEAPINILARPGAPSLERLHELGVQRATFGGGLHRLLTND